jgi:hypothetical protein
LEAFRFLPLFPFRRFFFFLPVARSVCLRTFLAATRSLEEGMCLTRWAGLRDWTPGYPATRSLTLPLMTLTFLLEVLRRLAVVDLDLVTAGMWSRLSLAGSSRALRSLPPDLSYDTRGFLPTSVARKILALCIIFLEARPLVSASRDRLAESDWRATFYTLPEYIALAA